MEPNAAMRLRAMQEEGDAHIGEVPGDDDEEHRNPPPAGPRTECEHDLLQGENPTARS
jgi:hypothetical protein